MNRIYKTPFKQFVKKAHKPLRLAIEDEVDAICDNPDIGEPKLGELSGIFVHKFKFNHQEYLIAYQPPMEDQKSDASLLEFLIIDFYKVGTHENFYNELKRYLREK
jgi:hypothetical protein